MHEGEVLMVRADEHDLELAALREELAQSRILAADQGLNLKRVKREFDASQQRLTTAEQRYDAFVEVVRKMYLDDGFTNEVCAAIEAALGMAKPIESARCMNCDRATVEQCDDAGCGFLGAGNGAPGTEPTEPGASECGPAKQS